MITRKSLNGTWQFVADLDPKYHAQHCDYHEPDTCRKHWLDVPIPGVWNTYDKRYDIFEGVCWLSREFKLKPIQRNAIVRIRFGAVNYACNVYVNGTLAGKHEGGYTEFVFDITSSVKAGENHIAVQVDNRATTIKWPPCLGYFNYGGIHRDVNLDILEGPSLDDIRITAVPVKGNGKLRVRGRVINPVNNLSVSVACNKHSKQNAVSTNGRFAVSMNVPDIKAWSPDNPALYKVNLHLKQNNDIYDSTTIRSGFRTIKVHNKTIMLNDQKIDLKGICYVYDSSKHGLVMTEKQLTDDLRLMKQLGVNAIRCHYPMNQKFYDMCDRQGFMVWIEPPIYCMHPKDNARNTPFSDPAHIEVAANMMQEMISAARNHASVMIYGIGNECNLKNRESSSFFKQMSQIARQADPARLISYAALYGNVGTIAQYIDVLGINSYWGWYDKIWGGKGLLPEEEGKTSKCKSIDLKPMRTMLDDVLKKKQDLALLLTEFGADSMPGLISKQRCLWSEDYHADLISAIFAMAEEYPQILGTFPFCFSDYRDPSKGLNAYWDEFNYKGVVTYQRKKKKAFTALTEVYK